MPQDRQLNRRSRMTKRSDLQAKKCISGISRVKTCFGTCYKRCQNIWLYSKPFLKGFKILQFHGSGNLVYWIDTLKKKYYYVGHLELFWCHFRLVNTFLRGVEKWGMRDRMRASLIRLRQCQGQGAGVGWGDRCCRMCVWVCVCVCYVLGRRIMWASCRSSSICPPEGGGRVSLPWKRSIQAGQWAQRSHEAVCIVSLLCSSSPPFPFLSARPVFPKRFS